MQLAPINIPAPGRRTAVRQVRPGEAEMSTEITSYTELIAGIQAKVESMGVKQSDFDELAGFAPGLSGKVFGMLQVRTLRLEKLFDAIRAAGLRIRLEDDPDQDA